MKQYEIGDLVWAVIDGKEQPAIVQGRWGLECEEHPGHCLHQLDIWGSICPTLLRPRRDDYQQREPTVSVDCIRRLMKDNGAILVSS